MDSMAGMRAALAAAFNVECCRVQCAAIRAARLPLYAARAARGLDLFTGAKPSKRTLAQVAEEFHAEDRELCDAAYFADRRERGAHQRDRRAVERATKAGAA